MAKKRRVVEEEPEEFEDEDIDFDEEFGVGEEDILAAQKIAVKALIAPSKKALYTLSDLSDREVKVLAQLETLAAIIPDPYIKIYVRKYLLLKRSRKRLGVHEIISIVGGRAWKLLQQIHLPRVRRERYEEME